MTRTGTPISVRRYVVAVIAVGALLATGTAAVGFEPLSRSDWARAAVLTLLATLAYVRPLRVAHKYSYDVSDVVHVAMILLFPLGLPSLLVCAAGGLHLIRRPTRTIDELFNVAQFVIHVAAGAICFAVVQRWAGYGPSLAGLASVGAIVTAVVTMLVINAALVSGAIALDAGARFLRLWRGEVINVAGTSAALASLGVVAALIVRDYPLALVPLVIPAGLAQYALRREVQLRADTRAALAGLVDIIELRDPYTAGHSERVATLARGLALRLGQTGEEADLIETAGRVHDLGKTAMSPSLLNKEGPLNEEEWREMRRHPVLGAEVLERFVGYGACAKLVRHHHEHWDGSGYPDGLGGDKIPIGARILAVADAFDALTTTRSYRPARGIDAALRILDEGAGERWDRQVVDALLEYRSEAANSSVMSVRCPLPT